MTRVRGQDKCMGLIAIIAVIICWGDRECAGSRSKEVCER